MRPSTTSRPLCILTFVAAIAGAFIASPPSAWALGDEDLDGVSDEVDACPGTPEGDLVGDTGCSVCPCDATAEGDDWASHDAYVQCIVQHVRSLKKTGRMSRRNARNTIRAAKKSSCGNPEMTRCCVFPDDDESDTIVGTCKVVTVSKCDSMTEALDWAEDMGPGSCTPNPCIF